MFLLSGAILDRLMMMSDKQDREMRQLAFSRMESSWISCGVREGASPGLRELLAEQPCARPRRLLFVRLAQTWNDLLRAIPEWRLADLAALHGKSAPVPPCVAGERAPEHVEAFLEGIGIDLGPARSAYQELQGDRTIAQLNRVRANFTALPAATLDALALHARWQVVANHAVYWEAGAQASL
jgi:hypothetical protein